MNFSLRLLQWFQERSEPNKLQNPIVARVVQVKDTYYLQLQTVRGGVGLCLQVPPCRRTGR